MSCFDPRHQLAAVILTALMSLPGVACQPLPQPFAHEAETVNPAAAPVTEYGGITILPISGVPKATSRALSQGLADALVARDILAGPGSSNPHSKFLQGTASVRTLDGQRTGVSIVWDLFDPGGTLLGTKTVARTVATRAWNSEDPRVIRLLAKGAGEPLALLVRNANGDGGASQTITLHVRAMDGVSPGDSTSFRRAMTAALKRRNFAIASSPGDAKLIIAGRLKLGPKSSEPRPVEIVWAVLDQGGTELGKLTQRNTVTPRLVRSGWTALAPVIADNAAGGLGDLVHRLPPETLQNRAKIGK